MTPRDVNTGPITSALALLPAVMDTAKARVMMLAIGQQESGLVYRKQLGGPARGLWQFEVTGVAGVLRATKYAQPFCAALDVKTVDVYYVQAMLEHDDVLAAGFARLLLWTDPKPLPDFGDADSALDLYLRTWRPGAYEHDPGSVRTRWETSYQTAVDALS